MFTFLKSATFIYSDGFPDISAPYHHMSWDFTPRNISKADFLIQALTKCEQVRHEKLYYLQKSEYN